MAVKTREWQNNAFWHTNEKDCAEAILVIKDESGREISQCLTVRKMDDSGVINPDFTELLEEVGTEQIDNNTKDRQEKKAKEKEHHLTRKKAEDQARELEKLFDTKIKMLDIECISNTKNKTLKSKLRRSKNIIELNMYAQLIVMEENGIGFVTYDTEQRD